MQYRKLNLGCGKNKIPNCLNIDINPEVFPDQIFDFTQKFPLEDKSFDIVYFFHTIEHIAKKFHQVILTEIHRILDDNGKLILTYPEFIKCAQNYINNYQGNREFWEATIYGRQRDIYDYHVALMNSEELVTLLNEVGYTNFVIGSEQGDEYNTVLKCVKCQPMKTYEDILREEIFQQ